jgi:hypothetical protein
MPGGFFYFERSLIDHSANLCRAYFVYQPDTELAPLVLRDILLCEALFGSSPPPVFIEISAHQSPSWELRSSVL